MEAISKLKSVTKEFSDKHWCEQEIDKSAPEWSEAYFLQGSMPNHDKQGVYAFLTKHEVIYIGVGASRGSGRYRGHGLGSRMQDHMKCIGPGTYEAKDKKLEEADYIVTIGFDIEQAYLAYALESFLISRLNPKHNRNAPGA
ncbi:MAG: hypothetical protein JRI72_10410 [Deltaproteobacteria bacterium]|nr:hypothetical protein [Deltaproteobacteria bacterium]